jgi:hypothetical protein
MALKTQLSNALTHIRGTPECLKVAQNATMVKLNDYLKSDGQGSANKATNQEACIATVLETYGFVLTVRNGIPETDGLYYWYQGKGSQQKGDFTVFEVSDGEMIRSVVIDAKHTNSSTFYLNDGWFDENTIYIISYKQTKKWWGNTLNMCLIGMGQDIPTDSDKRVMAHILAIKKELNNSKKTLGATFLKVVFRFANQYSCNQFQPEFNHELFQKTLAWL